MSVTSPVTGRVTGIVASGVTRSIGHRTREPDVIYFISPSGDNANDGSESLPWQSLSKINSTLVESNEYTRVVVKSGTYDKASDYIDCRPEETTNRVLEIVCEENTTWDGTAANSATDRAATLLSRAQFVIRGNGLLITNYNREGATPNGIGTFGGSVTRVYDVHTSFCGDGFSPHESARLFLYDCTSTDDDRAFIAVGTSYTECHRCSFDISASGTSGTGSNTATVKLYNCTLTPRVAGASYFPRGISHYKCSIGSIANHMSFTSSDILGSFFDCYVHCAFDGNSRISMRRCFGTIATRVRSGGGCDIQHCVITNRVATGAINAIPRATAELGASKLVISNNVFFGNYTLQEITPENAALLIAAESEFFSNCLFGGVAYDTDLTGAIGAEDVVKDTLAADPLIGAANTTNQSDWAVASISPCVGAGTAGGNIGFTLADIA